MARAAAKGGRRTQPDARRPQQRRRGGRRNLSTTEQTLFFSKIRRSAKWAYVLLAVVFAGTFAFLGVGSGNSGLDQLFNNIFHGGSGATSISKAQKDVQEHPRDAAAYQTLAQAYESHGRTNDAINALQQYVALRPKDAAQLQHLARLESAAADNALADAQLAAFEQQLSSAGSTFGPSATTKFGQALVDPITAAVSARDSLRAQQTGSTYQTASSAAIATYKKLTKAQPSFENYQLLATTAQRYQDYPTAIKAFKEAARHTNDPTLKAQMRAALKKLQAAAGKGAGG
jgi:tetratricopeptide (TPR) repeat protein